MNNSRMLAFLGLCFVVLMPIFVTSVQATPTEVGEPEAAGVHRIDVLYYKAHIYDDHDALGAGEWWFRIYVGGEWGAYFGAYSRDGPGDVNFLLGGSAYISTDTQFKCQAREDDGALGVHIWDYTSTTYAWNVNFPTSVVNNWLYHNQRPYPGGDVRHYFAHRVNNDAPTVGAISGPSAGYRLVAYTFSTSGADPEGDSITYEWSVDGVIQPTKGSSLTYTFGTGAAIGAHTIQVRTKDYFGRYSDYATRTFTIFNRAPTVSPILGFSSGSTGVPYMYSATGSDPDGDSITYVWSVNWVTQPATGSSLTYTFPTAGTYTVRVRTKDSHGMYSSYSSKTVTITADKVDTEIVFTFSPNPANPGVTVLLSGTLKDADTMIPITPADVTVEYSTNGGTTWNYIWTLNTNAAGAFSRSFPAPGVGTYLARVSYAGSVTYNPSSHTETLNVQTTTTVDTTVTFTFSPNPANPGQTVTLSGTLEDISSNPVYPAQIEVYYSLNGGVSWNYIWTLPTNTAGQFSKTFTAPGVGTYLVGVSYEGSATYNPSTDTETLAVN